MLRDRLFIWTIRRDGIEFEAKPVDGVRLQALIGSFETGLRNGGVGPELSHSSTALYELLISPIHDRISRGTELTVVLGEGRSRP